MENSNYIDFMKLVSVKPINPKVIITDNWIEKTFKIYNRFVVIIKSPLIKTDSTQYFVSYINELNILDGDGVNITDTFTHKQLYNIEFELDLKNVYESQQI